MRRACCLRNGHTAYVGALLTGMQCWHDCLMTAWPQASMELFERLRLMLLALRMLDAHH